MSQPLRLTRRVLTPGDPLRNWVPVWHHDGVPPHAFLKNPFGYDLELTPEAVSLNPSHAASWSYELFVPADVPPGDYFLTLGRDDDYAAPVRVSPRPPERRVTHFRPDTSCLSHACVQEAIDRGDEVVFLPGDYHFTEALNLIPNSYLRGRHARLYRLDNDNPADYGRPLFRGGQDCTVEGLELVPLNDQAFLFYNPAPTTGLVLRECLILEGTFGHSLGDVTCLYCVWDGGGIADSAPPGLYYRCRFQDNHVAHAFAMRGPAVGRYALIDCTFSGTDRGPVHRCLAGPVSDNLIVGLFCENVRRDQNGNEMVSAEGQAGFGFDRNLIISSRVQNCAGNFFLPWDAPARGNRVRDLVVQDGGGVWLAGVHDMNDMGNFPEVSGNVIEQFEFRRTDGLRLGWRDGYGRAHGLGVRDNVVRDGAFLDFVPSRLNQGNYDPATYARLDFLDVVNCGPGNRLSNVTHRQGGRVQVLNVTIPEGTGTTAP